jgi:SAM-dependent methyltransferase
MTGEPPDHVARNRSYWDGQAEFFAVVGAERWAAAEPYWGVWDVPESQLGVLAHDLDNLDAIELGCGTGYVSKWLADRGARPVGIDSSPKQLQTARRLRDEHGMTFELLLGNAEAVPYPDASFDFAISEYGASIWCDPHLWIPEAARLLRPGAMLVFLVNAPLHMLCMPDEIDVPAGDRLLRPYFGMHRFEWSDDESVGFHLPHGELIALLRSCGFQIEELIEVRPAQDAAPAWPPTYSTLEWARKWPVEEVWKVRRA